MADHLLHRTGPADRWDTIAARYYGNGALTHILTRANRHLFVDGLTAIPPILPAGIEIIVPVLPAETVDPDQLPPWRR